MPTRYHWLVWPGFLALGPLTVGFVYFAYFQGWSFIAGSKMDAAAIPILIVAIVLFLLRTVVQRHPLYLLMACFATIACLREWHPPWMHHGVYYMLVVLIVWAWLWRERIRPLIRQGLFLPWFKATMATYFVAVLFARRAFRPILPYEEEVNTPLEETLENVAHLLLLLIGLLKPWPVLTLGQRSAQRQTER